MTIVWKVKRSGELERFCGRLGRGELTGATTGSPSFVWVRLRHEERAIGRNYCGRLMSIEVGKRNIAKRPSDTVHAGVATCR